MCLTACVVSFVLAAGAMLVHNHTEHLRELRDEVERRRASKSMRQDCPLSVTMLAARRLILPPPPGLRSSAPHTARRAGLAGAPRATRSQVGERFGGRGRLGPAKRAGKHVTQGNVTTTPWPVSVKYTSCFVL